ncbi:MAG TPA: sigma-70 family RNA polymerase sigma factor [Candidatus Binataceae bacterium]|nr:sigma-70 family RNA polymerase sigma factor [Candidatus Binataceae bacterium]
MGKSSSLRDRRLRFEQAALPHLDALYTSALRLARNRDDAEDLLQDTVLRAYRSFHQFSPGTNCRAWLLTILYNHFRSDYRRGWREQLANTGDEFERELEASSIAQDEGQDNPEQIAAGHSTAQLIQKALTTLPEEFRETLLLVDLQELNYQEVSEVLAIPLGTVKSRISRGRTMLRVALEKLKIGVGKTGT